MRTINKGQRRIANCECGARLAGGTDEELFEAVKRHLEHHHPQLLGALEPDVVFQMAEAVGASKRSRAPGGIAPVSGGR